MIKFKYRYPIGFIQNLKENFIANNVLKKSNIIYKELIENSPNDAVIYKDFLKSSSIHSFIFCKNTNLKGMIDQVYEKYPLMADRFCPSWIFNKYVFEFQLLDLDLSIEKNLTTVINYKKKLYLELKKIERERGSKLAKNLIEKLEKLKTAKSIIKLLFRIKYICLGRSRLANKILDQYPSWFKDIPSIFNYDKLRADFGIEIISSSDLKICPYCNARKIEIVKGMDTIASPDLDHFHPKSSYPFFAITLSNLIPSCWYCNQKFKREKDTYQGYLHPLINGTESYSVFKFSPYLDGQPKIQMEGCTKFNKNISMFELEAVYCIEAYQKTYKNIEDILDISKELKGSLNSVLDDSIFVKKIVLGGVGLTTKNTIDYKFKLDVLSHLTHNNYRK